LRRPFKGGDLGVEPDWLSEIRSLLARPGNVGRLTNNGLSQTGRKRNGKSILEANVLRFEESPSADPHVVGVGRASGNCGLARLIWRLLAVVYYDWLARIKASGPATSVASEIIIPMIVAGENPRFNKTRKFNINDMGTIVKNMVGPSHSRK